ncbi:NAD(P)-binding protein [Stipitochalara longipes BDJ]|nr:NAD(P)-binding protein [Stipitochalara longipes BDJ]
MPSEIVLVTGGTGHVGFKVLVNALEAGYDIRAAIRDPSKKELILSTKSIKALNPASRLTFTIVSDITADGAYDEAVKGVKYVIHVASPLANASLDPKDFETLLILPAVKGTLNMLEAAQKISGIKRVVITGSNASIIPTTAIIGSEDSSDETYDEAAEAEAAVPPIDSPYVAYCSSKIEAYKATKSFLAKEKPSFDVITLMPSFVIGKNELVTDPKKITDGSNGFAFGQILGLSLGFSGSGSTVHLDDVAKVHVLALDPKIPGNTNYILNSGGLNGTVWSDAIGIVARNYPEAVAAGLLPNNGVMETHKLVVDASKVEKAFGIKLLDFEAQIKSLTNHFLELV